jgi:hypothetical protein
VVQLWHHEQQQIFFYQSNTKTGTVLKQMPWCQGRLLWKVIYKDFKLNVSAVINSCYFLTEGPTYHYTA